VFIYGLVSVLDWTGVSALGGEQSRAELQQQQGQIATDRRRPVRVPERRRALHAGPGAGDDESTQLCPWCLSLSLDSGIRGQASKGMYSGCLKLCLRVCLGG
jgi:hypothetical protein